MFWSPGTGLVTAAGAFPFALILLIILLSNRLMFSVGGSGCGKPWTADPDVETTLEVPNWCIPDALGMPIEALVPAKALFWSSSLSTCWLFNARSETLGVWWSSAFSAILAPGCWFWSATGDTFFLSCLWSCCLWSEDGSLRKGLLPVLFFRKVGHGGVCLFWLTLGYSFTTIGRYVPVTSSTKT